MTLSRSCAMTAFILIKDISNNNVQGLEMIPSGTVRAYFACGHFVLTTLSLLCVSLSGMADRP